MHQRVHYVEACAVVKLCSLQICHNLLIGTRIILTVTVLSQSIELQRISYPAYM